VVQDRNEVVTKIREAKADLEARYSVRRIGVFGSFVRGSASADSDVDILAELFWAGPFWMAGSSG